MPSLLLPPKLNHSTLSVNYFLLLATFFYTFRFPGFSTLTATGLLSSGFPAAVLLSGFPGVSSLGPPLETVKRLSRLSVGRLFSYLPSFSSLAIPFGVSSLPSFRASQVVKGAFRGPPCLEGENSDRSLGKTRSGLTTCRPLFPFAPIARRTVKLCRPFSTARGEPNKRVTYRKY